LTSISRSFSSSRRSCSSFRRTDCEAKSSGFIEESLQIVSRHYQQAGDTENIHSSAALDALAELLGTVVLVQEIVGDFLEVSQMAVEEG